jgi:hypothetical protein
MKGLSLLAFITSGQRKAWLTGLAHAPLERRQQRQRVEIHILVMYASHSIAKPWLILC